MLNILSTRPTPLALLVLLAWTSGVSPAIANDASVQPLNLSLPKEVLAEPDNTDLSADLSAPLPLLLPITEQDLSGVQPRRTSRKSGKATIKAEAVGEEQAKAPRGSAQGILKAYFQAQEHEPTFQTAKAEFEALRVSASAARAALLPEFRYTKQRTEIESSERETMALSVPLLAFDRIFTFREGSHRDKISALTYLQREQELAQRVFKVISEITKHSESLRANHAKLLALKQQYDSARKMHALGEGTITDISDTQVRFGQARAEHFNIQGKLAAALKQLELTTGVPTPAKDFAVAKDEKQFPLAPEDIELPYTDEGRFRNTQVGLAQENYELARLGTNKSLSSLLPNLTGSYVMTKRDNVETSYTGLAISMPIQASTAWGVYGAKAAEAKARESVKEAENKALIEIEKFKALLEAGILEVKHRKENIEATALNVRANEKSMKGGVKAKTDILNAIQTHYQAHEEYVSSLLTLADNYLNYLLVVNVPPEAAIQLVAQLLHKR